MFFYGIFYYFYEVNFIIEFIDSFIFFSMLYLVFFFSSFFLVSFFFIFLLINNICSFLLRYSWLTWNFSLYWKYNFLFFLVWISVWVNFLNLKVLLDKFDFSFFGKLVFFVMFYGMVRCFIFVELGLIMFLIFGYFFFFVLVIRMFLFFIRWVMFMICDSLIGFVINIFV